MKMNKQHNRNIRFTVRLNEKEAKWIKEAAWREKRSIADFMRDRVLGGDMPRIPASVEDLLKELSYEINKVGVNINQLVRNYHINGYQTGYEKKKLEEDLGELFAMRDLVCGEIRRMMDGGYKVKTP